MDEDGDEAHEFQDSSRKWGSGDGSACLEDRDRRSGKVSPFFQKRVAFGDTCNRRRKYFFGSTGAKRNLCRQYIGNLFSNSGGVE
jgi:hypothetical protein